MAAAEEARTKAAETGPATPTAPPPKPAPVKSETDPDGEGLGDDFRATGWATPSEEVARDHRRSSMFEDGEASVCKTSIDQLSAMGVGVGLHFFLLRTCAITLAICSVLATPHLLMCWYGDGLDKVDYDFTHMIRLTAVNHMEVLSSNSTNTTMYCDPEWFAKRFSDDDVISYSSDGMIQIDTAFEKNVNCNKWMYDIPILETLFGTPFVRARHMSYIVGWADVLISLTVCFSIIHMSRMVRKVTQRVNSEHVSVQDYAVYVTGLPADVTEEKVCEHFSALYQLSEPSWSLEGKYCCRIGKKAARTPDDVKDHLGNAVGPSLLPVQPGAAQNAHAPGMFDGKWVCEVELVRPEGAFIRTFRAKADGVKRLKLARAKVKMLEARAASGKPGWFFKSKMAKAEKKLKKREESISRSTKGLVENAKEYQKVKDRCIAAFVVFNHEESYRRCIDDYNKPQSMLARLLTGKPAPLKYVDEAAHPGEAYPLRVEPADTPGNVMWENLETSKYEILLRQGITGFVAFLLLVATGCVVAALKMEIRTQSERIPTTDTCQNDIPYAYGAYKGWVPTYVRMDSTELSDAGLGTCTGGTFWLGFDESPDKYRRASWNDTCTAPCIKYDAGEDANGVAGDENMQCAGSDGVGYKYSRNDVVGCYCMQELSFTDECEVFGAAWIAIQVFVVLASVSISVINMLLIKAIKMLGDFEHNKSVTDRMVSVTSKMFGTLFINTGILVVVVNAEFDAPFLNDLGLFNEGTQSYDAIWYTSVGAAMFLTMTINTVTPHLTPLFQTWVLGPLMRCKAHYGRGFLTQFQMNDAYRPPSFKLEERSAHMLNTLAVTLAFSPGLPVLLPIATVALGLSYVVDKYLLLRLYRKPPPYNHKLPEQVLATMPYIVLLHLANAVWLYGEPEVFDSAVGPPGIQGSDELVAEYEEGVEYAAGRVGSDGILAEAIKRATRTNAMPVFALLAVLFVLKVLSATVVKVLMFLVALTPLKKYVEEEELAEQEFNPPYTEAYERYFPPHETWRMQSCSLEQVPTEPPDLPAERGWRSELRDGAYCLYKVDTEKSGGAGSVAVAAENTAPLKTFEVVSESGLCTYQMRKNPLYEDVIMARDSLLSSMGVEEGGGGGSGSEDAASAAAEAPETPSPLKKGKSKKKDSKKVLPVVAGAQ